MSVEEAKNFYGHLTPIFAKKLAPKVNAILKKNLSNAFDFEMTDLEYEVCLVALLITINMQLTGNDSPLETKTCRIRSEQNNSFHDRNISTRSNDTCLCSLEYIL